MTEIICSVIAAAATVLCAIVARNGKLQYDHAEKRGELRKRESLLMLRMTDAALQLSIVSANALTGGHNNGNVELARKASEDAANEYKKFMQEITAHEISK